MTGGAADDRQSSTLRFVMCDPQQPPASELLAEMTAELNALYETTRRLEVPKVDLAELRAPTGVYLVGWEGQTAVAGGGVRPLDRRTGEIKRMFVRPAARRRGVAGALLAELEARALSMGFRTLRLDTGPKQVDAISLYQRAGFVSVAPYNDNPFASFWGEKSLNPLRQ